jgi:2-hydroxycyclohexanecarboxyl-CoA dehydrogenase
MTDQRSSRVAVVTGGGSGMGRSTCEQLAAHGHRVAVLDINEENARAVADEICGTGGDAFACAVDVADRSSVHAAVDRVQDQLGPVEILVTSAGISRFEPLTEIEPESWHRVLEVNLTGTFYCAQAVVPDMIAAHWGRIVTISSSSAQRGSPRMAHYAASKGGVIALTKSMARELAPHAITVNNIPPSGIDTPMSREALAAGHLVSPEEQAKAIPLGRLGTGDDIASACVFLCSEEASFITGQVLGVNGGSVL